jgi:orotate phosphoribosyltransferase
MQRKPPFMTENEANLLQLLKERSYKEGDFILASGAKSDYFIDVKMTQAHSFGAFLIGEVIHDRSKDLGVDAIGGLQVGAIPLATAAVISYHHRGRPMEGFWVRDAVKDHGTKKLVEGGIQPGCRVLIVEDVCTKGGSAMKAVEAVQQMGCTVVKVLGLVDRKQGARELFAEKGVPFETVFTIDDLRLK